MDDCWRRESRFLFLYFVIRFHKDSSTSFKHSPQDYSAGSNCSIFLSSFLTLLIKIEVIFSLNDEKKSEKSLENPQKLQSILEESQRILKNLKESLKYQRKFHIFQGNLTILRIITNKYLGKSLEIAVNTQRICRMLNSAGSNCLIFICY